MNANTRDVIYERPWMYPEQQAAIYDWRRYSWIEATTKAGKSLGCSWWILEQAMAGRRGHNFWWVAPIFAQAKIIFRRLKQSLEETAAGLYTTNESECTITLANGAVIWFKGADRPDTLYGEDVWAAVIDECSRVKETAWHAVRSTLTATRGPVRLIGNVKGRRNWFYKAAHRAEATPTSKTNAYHKITWRHAVAAGILDADEIEDARAQLPPEVFRELYEAEASDDQGNPFGYQAIAECVMPTISGDPPVAWGIDLGKRTDFTCATGLDRRGRVCRFERWRRPWRETVADLLRLIDHRPALVDSTGVGDPVLEELQHAQAQVEGYVFTTKSKQALMEKLRTGIQTRAVGIVEGVQRTELDTFEYEHTRTGIVWSAPEGYHDDAVMSLALAWWQRDAVGVNSGFRAGRVRPDSTPEGSVPMTSNGRFPIGREIIL